MASDLYSLGVIGYEMLTGIHPFGDHSAASMERQVRGDFEPLSDLRPDAPTRFVAQIESFLSPRPHNREQCIDAY